MMKRRRPNRLIHETSLYLLQHAENPVDWYPWGDEALSHARAEDKPILLSIGYSACHWCHVMAHESFENEAIARFMNDNYVNIKVDREERPDLDTLYMEAVQAITGSGGWPLTVFLTPEGKPFYGGTYFPPGDRHGQPGFMRVLSAALDAYRNNRAQVEESTGQIVATLKSRNAKYGRLLQVSANILDRAYANLVPDFDRFNGGFGQAPKFPQPMVLEFLLRQYHRTGDKAALDMATLTLVNMARGGIYDQLGGGFHRYSTDSRWLVPHFEKMLYDNALLSRVYLQAYLITRKPLFRHIAEETINYVLREMTDPQGGFYSTQDADSEGEEGKYYLWTLDEMKKVLGEETAVSAGSYYGVSQGGNFEGRNILHLAGHISMAGTASMEHARALLLKEREKRVKPGRDEKMLASWNGMMLASLAEAAGVFSRRDYLLAATASGSFLSGSMTSQGRLRHVCSNGRSSVDVYLEDYALAIEGFLSLHQVTFGGSWLTEAVRLAQIMIDEFWDESEELFYDTGKRLQNLFMRPRSVQDGALPSGISAAVMVLLKLSRLTGEGRFEEYSRKALGNLGETMAAFPLGFGNWLCALDFYLSPGKEIVVVGQRDNPATEELLHVIFNQWLPNKVFAARDPDNTAAAADLALLENRNMVNNQSTVYICEHSTCSAPINDPDMLRSHLDVNKSS